MLVHGLIPFLSPVAFIRNLFVGNEGNPTESGLSGKENLLASITKQFKSLVRSRCPNDVTKMHHLSYCIFQCGFPLFVGSASVCGGSQKFQAYFILTVNNSRRKLVLVNSKRSSGIDFHWITLASIPEPLAMIRSM